MTGRPPSSDTVADPEPGGPERSVAPWYRRRPGRRGLAIGAAALLAAAGLGIGLAVATGDDAPGPPGRAEVGTIAAGVVDEAIEKLRQEPATSALVYQQILPSIVTIEADAKDDEDGLGTGVIIDRRGRIMTAFHVVDGARSLRVTFADGTRSPASVASSDPDIDIAVLTAERGPGTIVPAVLGGGGQIGDEAYAVGHPLGYVGSLSSGVISGLERSVKAENGRTLKGLIQFDTAVNPGNSGGPLLNRAGQVIGIVTALANPGRDGFFIGIGFAVPIGTAGGGAGAPPK